jgi:germination protein M
MLSNSDAMTKRALLSVAVVVLAGCGGAEPNAVTSAPPAGTGTATTATETTAQTMPARAYFLRDDKVAASEAQVPKSAAVARAAIEALLAGSPPGLTTAIPDGTRLRHVSIADGVATVDLSGEFRSGDAATVPARLAQVVYTLTQFPSVDGVRLELDGEPVAALGDVALERPQTRADYDDQTPIIFVETPLPGDRVSSPVRLAGTSNVYEANMHLDVYQGENKIVDTFFSASSGSGERGTFETSVPLDVTGPVRIVLYAPSAEDGTPQHLVEVPVDVSG